MLYAKFGWNEPRGSWEDFKIFLHNFAFSILFPLGERPGPPFFQTWIRSTQECFVPSLVKIGPVVLEKKLKMWKVYRHTDRQTDRQMTDNRQSEKLTKAFSSGELIKTQWLKIMKSKLSNLVINLHKYQSNQKNQTSSVSMHYKYTCKYKYAKNPRLLS